MLSRIRAMGKKIGIITDGRPEGQRAKLDALEIETEYIIVTDESAPFKDFPHAVGYLRSAKSLCNFFVAAPHILFLRVKCIILT